MIDDLLEFTSINDRLILSLVRRMYDVALNIAEPKKVVEIIDAIKGLISVSSEGVIYNNFRIDDALIEKGLNIIQTHKELIEKNYINSNILLEELVEYYHRSSEFIYKIEDQPIVIGILTRGAFYAYALYKLLKDKGKNPMFSLVRFSPNTCNDANVKMVKSEEEIIVSHADHQFIVVDDIAFKYRSLTNLKNFLGGINANRILFSVYLYKKSPPEDFCCLEGEKVKDYIVSFDTH